MLAGHASISWLSELGAGMPYNREKKIKSSLHPQMQYYRQLVPLIELDSPQPLVKSVALLGLH